MEEQKAQWIGVTEIQKNYLPLSKRKIREILKKNLDVTRTGKKILVEKKQLELFLRNEL